MKDSMARPGQEEPQVMLQLPLPSRASRTCSSPRLRFHRFVPSQPWKGLFFFIPKRGNSTSTLSK